ncbi:MAG: hypothetical protein M3R06_08145, partial [Chloroflexota bacterium]|nr:hypothetical protein [Chloroflexota bacterium]
MNQGSERYSVPMTLEIVGVTRLNGNIEKSGVERVCHRNGLRSISLRSTAIIHSVSRVPNYMPDRPRSTSPS